MSLDYQPVVEAVKARLSTLNVPIIDTHSEAHRENGILVPYLMLSFGGPVQAARGRGIVGSVKNPHLMWVHAHCISEDIGVSRSIKNQVIPLLTDFTPENCGPFTMVGGYPDTITSQDSAPVRFDEALRFSFSYNLNSL